MAERTRIPEVKSQAQIIAESIIELSRRHGVRILDSIYYRQTQLPEVFIILNTPRRSRIPGSGTNGAREYGLLNMLIGSATLDIDFEETPFSVHMVSAPDMTREQLIELLEGAQKIPFNLEN